MIYSARNLIFRSLLLFLSSVFVAGNGAYAEETHYKPFVLAQVVKDTDINVVVESVRKKLTENNFEIVGTYNPYEAAVIIVVTNAALKQNATQSDFGAFGAIQRISVTKTAAGIQVSYTNPTYMAHVYRMKGDLADVSGSLGKALGRDKEYGSEKGLTKEELRKYQYKWLMPYFDDRLRLASYSDYKAAIAVVEKNLKSNKPKVSQVYRVDLPGKEETIIGLKMPGVLGTECSGDDYVMSRIDFKDIKSSAHLPYELVISKGKIVGLPAEFRIAINFPDLSMMGSNSFASIMCAPEAVRTALTTIAGGSLDDH